MFMPLEEGDAAVVYEKGVFRQCPLYVRAGELYAKLGSGYIRLKADGSTSKPAARLDQLEFEGPLFASPLGRLAVEPGPNRRPMVAASGDEGFKALPAPENTP